ncbi:uncharacterized protein ATC70_007173 [Mucor velutinosus]|uniref:Uncharacterized protein n=1 Tax=Mucor velutinosus TaxID=708070 RepID=A0AAN7HJY2_9FUNG|nr:hypothetical protein ATC70_007173 [Mucor velutinosus]
MNLLASSSIASSTIISKLQARRFRLDRILADLEAEDSFKPENVADHSIRLFIDERQRSISARLYDRYVKVVENVTKLFISSTLFRNFARKAVPSITQNNFKERFLTRCNALTTEEEVEDQVEEQEIAPDEASAQLLGSQMSVDEAIAVSASQVNPTALTYSQVTILMFESAQDYFTVYQASKVALKSQQRKLMSCGASLILDLVDMTDGN